MSGPLGFLIVPLGYNNNSFLAISTDTFANMVELLLLGWRRKKKAAA
jgi:hypothetical protein